jgi:hnRNP-L/PTB/hephaestus splicing factor
LFNKKDTALVQYVDYNMAQNAIQQLDRCRWWGKTLKVSLSKHANIQMPRDNASDAWMTKDFAESPLNRFRSKNAKGYNNLNYPPSATLHLSNIPADVTEDDLKDMFSDYGTVIAFKFFANDRKMALIQLDSQEEAVAALVGLHNYELAGRQHLRVSFTKSVI